MLYCCTLSISVSSINLLTLLTDICLVVAMHYWCVCVLLHASVSFYLVSSHVALLPHCCVYLKSRTLVVMVLLVLVPNWMRVGCVEGTGAHAFVATTLLKRH